MRLFLAHVVETATAYMYLIKCCLFFAGKDPLLGNNLDSSSEYSKLETR